MKKAIIDTLLSLPTLLFKLVIVGVILLSIYGSGQYETIKENCHYGDIDSCKVVFDKEGLTGLSKVVGEQ